MRFNYVNIYACEYISMNVLELASCIPYCGVHTLRDPSGYPSGGSPLIGTVSPGPNWPFLSPP